MIKERISNRIDKEVKALEDEQARYQTQIDALQAKEGKEAEIKKLEEKVALSAKKIDLWNSFSSGPQGKDEKEKEKPDDAPVKKGKDKK